MTLNLTIVGILLCLIPSSLLAESKRALVVERGEEVCTLFKSFGPDGGSWEIEIKLSKQFNIKGELEMTSKGNGTLRVANLHFRLYDDHNDGVLFDKRCLNVTLKDLNHDGILDLEVSGAIQEMDEKDEDKVLRTRFIRKGYIYDQKTKTFVPGSGPVDKDFELKRGQ